MIRSIFQALVEQERVVHRLSIVRRVQGQILGQLKRIHQRALLVYTVSDRVMSPGPFTEYLSSRVWNDVVERFEDNLPYLHFVTGAEVDLEGWGNRVADAILRE